jgi:chromosomal replication initiator protein
MSLAADFHNARKVQPQSDHVPSVADIQRATCRHFNLQKHELRANRRNGTIVKARQTAMYLCRNLTTRSLPQIGIMFGGFHHTTVMHAHREIEKKVRNDWRVAYDVATIEGELR